MLQNAETMPGTALRTREDCLPLGSSNHPPAIYRLTAAINTKQQQKYPRAALSLCQAGAPCSWQHFPEKNAACQGIGFCQNVTTMSQRCIHSSVRREKPWRRCGKGRVNPCAVCVLQGRILFTSCPGDTTGSLLFLTRKDVPIGGRIIPLFLFW